MKHQEICHTIMSNKFNHSLKKGCFHYEKIASNHIVLYEWENGFVYRAMYKCLPNKINLAQACIYIESKFKVIHKRGEYIMFAHTLQKTEVAGLTIRELRLQDELLLEQMKAQCAQKEVEVAQISIHDVHPIGAFIDGVLVAAVSILDLWGAYDIGVICHPQFRNRKIARALAYASAEWANQQGHVSMYRCDDDNVASYHCGASLGFQADVRVMIYEIEK